MATFGPKITARERNRFRASAGHGITKKFKDGTVVTYDTDPIMVDIADAFVEIAALIGERASGQAADDPLYVNNAGQRIAQPGPGFGLPTNWGVMAWVFGKLIYAHKAAGSERFSKPRAFRTAVGHGADAIIGYGFPGRFVELGTANMPARPFLGPAALEVLSGSEPERIIARHIPAGDR